MSSTVETHPNELAQAIARLSLRSAAKIQEWLCQGLVDYFGLQASEAFSPYNFIMTGDRPIHNLVISYKHGAFPLKRKLRRALDASLALVISESTDAITLTDLQRYSVLKAITDLVPHFYCFEACERLSYSVVDDLISWDSEDVREKAFSVALGAICELAIRGIGSVNWQANKDKLEGNLWRMVRSNGYNNKYAPITMRALVSLDPKKFVVDHLEEFNRRISELHRLDPEQLKHAYLTAEMLLLKALPWLQKNPHRLGCNRETGESGWFLEALGHPDSGWKVFRAKRDVRKISLSKSGESLKSHHPHLEFSSTDFVNFRAPHSDPDLVYLREISLGGAIFYKRQLAAESRHYEREKMSVLHPGLRH